MKKIIGLAAGMFMLAACGNANNINSEWLQPIPGMEGQVQGMRLNADGSAASVNMHTLLYKSWQKTGDELILSGESLGNGQTIHFTEKYHIEKLDGKNLILDNGRSKLIFTRK